MPLASVPLPIRCWACSGRSHFLSVGDLDLGPDLDLYRHLPQPRSVRLGQGAVVLVRVVHPADRHPGLPDRARRLDARAGRAAGAQEDAESRSYIRQAAADPANSADQLAKLADLRDRGVISAEEFEREKAKVLAA